MRSAGTGGLPVFHLGKPHHGQSFEATLGSQAGVFLRLGLVQPASGQVLVEDVSPPLELEQRGGSKDKGVEAGLLFLFFPLWPFFPKGI